MAAATRSSNWASATSDASWAATVTSMRISLGRKTRGSTVCTTSTPSSSPLSTSGTPRKE